MQLILKSTHMCIYVGLGLYTWVHVNGSCGAAGYIVQNCHQQFEFTCALGTSTPATPKKTVSR